MGSFLYLRGRTRRSQHVNRGKFCTHKIMGLAFCKTFTYHTKGDFFQITTTWVHRIKIISTSSGVDIVRLFWRTSLSKLLQKGKVSTKFEKNRSEIVTTKAHIQ